MSYYIHSIGELTWDSNSSNCIQKLWKVLRPDHVCRIYMGRENKAATTHILGGTPIHSNTWGVVGPKNIHVVNRNKAISCEMSMSLLTYVCLQMYVYVCFTSSVYFPIL